MLNRRQLLAVAPGLALAAPPKRPKFERKYFYLNPQTKMVLVDMAFGSDKVGWALGGIVKERSTKGIMLWTKDGGLSWEQVPLEFIPESLFVLDDSQIWAVSDKGEIWSSAEGGRDWRKMGRKKEAKRVHFLDAQRGFLVGDKKTFMKTADGGKSWDYVPEGAQVTGRPDQFVYRTVDFWNGKIGMVSGGVEPEEPKRRRRSAELPDWMRPELGLAGNSEPKVLVILQTTDAGATWQKQEVSAFGKVGKIVIGSNGVGMVLIQFKSTFTFGGELMSFYPGGKRSGELLLRMRNLEMHDVIYVPGDGAYLAGTARQGGLPVPTKVHVLHSKDLKTWTEVAVDYRASARKVVLSATPSGRVFALLDQGTILALEP